MSDRNWPWQGSDRAMTIPLLRDPREFPFGILLMNDAPMALNAGGGDGFHKWFSSLEELKAYLVEVESEAMWEGQEWESRRAALREELRTVSDTQEVQRVWKELDPRPTWWIVEWVGTFEEMSRSLTPSEVDALARSLMDESGQWA